MTLRATRHLAVLDRYRVPVTAHDLDEGRVPRLVGEAGELRWAARVDRPLSQLRLGNLTLFARPLPDTEAAALLGRGWEPAEPVFTNGHVAASVWRSATGVFLPFDPDEAVDALLREQYVELVGGRLGGLKAAARDGYYGIRPLLPRRAQLALRRRFTRVQENRPFPRWPAETALLELEALVLGLAERAAGSPLPWIAPWPDGLSWAVVLTHDVERAAGLARIDAIAGLEERIGLRSAWFLVPERDYTVTAELVQSLSGRGHEVALHGLRHDGRDLSTGSFQRRLPAMRRYAEQWGAVGFRSPATHRDWGRIAGLGLDYDSSWCDVARYEPQWGGSCSVLPFFVGDVVELPITLPMDHTLFELLGRRDESTWLEKADLLRRRGSLALLLTHPDYLGDDGLLAAYERFLQAVAGDPSAWHALPRDVSAWWRARASSRIVADSAGWRVDGPAAERGVVRVGVPGAVYAPAGPVA